MKECNMKNVIDLYGERQLFEVRRYMLTEGKANGVNCIDVDLGNLTFTLVADRGLDIQGLKFCGTQVAFISKNGIVSPSYYNPETYGWLDSFGGGFLTTCGLASAGGPCEYEGIKHGLHGRFSHIPAENISVRRENRSGDLYVIIEGLVRESRLMGCDYELHRKIEAKVGGDSFTLNDRIVNASDTPQPLMLLYHINFGYPFICPDTELEIPGSLSIEPFDKNAEEGLSTWDVYPLPKAGIPEQVFLHKVKKDKNGISTFTLKNNVTSPKMRLDVRYSADSLPYLTQWKSLRPGEYVTALEPCNNHVKGVAWEKENGNLRMLKPGEEEHMMVEFCFTKK